MFIPLLARGRAGRASSADSIGSRRKLFHFFRTAKFRNPLPHPARTVVLRHRFSGNNLRVVDPANAKAIETSHPAILAGAVADLKLLQVKLAGLKAIVVLSRAPMTAEERNWVWDRFQVPCFEQLVDSRNRVLAEECEVHCGLHVLEPDAVDGTRTSAECDCGRTEPRVAVPSLR